ncbi:hypothetical protein [uncultured Pseudodesulfovibrio sp.]|uniref:hypothetical protein n=1 Tax=uncultured Pseudodesulfovibrio sp. TaxID=2035858 RepID=UPI003749148C
MTEYAAQFNCRRFLFDERMVDKTIDAHDLAMCSDCKADEPQRWMRVAIVYTPENLSKLRWMETILRNRSLSYRQFSSFDEAEKWLLS